MLIAMNRIIEKMREIVPKGQLAIDHIGTRIDVVIESAMRIDTGKTHPLRLACIRRIKCAESTDRCQMESRHIGRIGCAFRLIGGRIPQAPIIHAGY